MNFTASRTCHVSKTPLILLPASPSSPASFAISRQEVAIRSMLTHNREECGIKGKNTHLYDIVKHVCVTQEQQQWLLCPWQSSGTERRPKEVEGGVCFNYKYHYIFTINTGCLSGPPLIAAASSDGLTRRMSHQTFGASGRLEESWQLCLLPFAQQQLPLASPVLFLLPYMVTREVVQERKRARESRS